MKLIKASRNSTLCILFLTITPQLLNSDNTFKNNSNKSIFIDNQSLLAGGEKISLNNLSYETLIKLPQTSDTLAREILKLSEKNLSNEKELLKSLMLIKGIGIKKSQRYLQFIKLNETAISY